MVAFKNSLNSLRSLTIRIVSLTFPKLYSLSLLPQLSICDEDVLETLYSDLILNNAIFDASKFGQTLKLLQDRYSCLGIQCSLVGSHVSADETWPICVDTKDPDIVTNIAGYIPFSKELNEWSKIDLDVSTILSFLVMEVRRTVNLLLHTHYNHIISS